MMDATPRGVERAGSKKKPATQTGGADKVTVS
jgi:hypothetical protein